MRWFAKTLTGFTIAMLILGVSALLGGKYLYAQLTTPPPKPYFPNDNPNYVKQAKKKAVPSAAEDRPIAKGKDDKPEEKKADKPLPPGAYESRVIQPMGLILRQGPEGASSGNGVEYNEVLVVLETSSDGAWSKVRSGSREGWVKSGNLEKTSDSKPAEKPAEKPADDTTEKPGEKPPQ
jgi:hypothetical protein